MRVSIFIHTDILVLVCEFVVVVILFEWWLFCVSGGQCHGPEMRWPFKWFHLNQNHKVELAMMNNEGVMVVYTPYYVYLLYKGLKVQMGSFQAYL